MCRLGALSINYRDRNARYKCYILLLLLTIGCPSSAEDFCMNFVNSRKYSAKVWTDLSTDSSTQDGEQLKK